MAHDTLKNKSYKIPDLHVRNPHAWYPADFDEIHRDPLIDPIEGEVQREGWGEEVTDPNYFSTAIDEEDAHYGTKLGSLAVGLDGLDKDVDNEDEDRATDPSDDEDDHEDIEGDYGKSQ